MEICSIEIVIEVQGELSKAEPGGTHVNHRSRERSSQRSLGEGGVSWFPRKGESERWSGQVSSGPSRDHGTYLQGGAQI